MADKLFGTVKAGTANNSIPIFLTKTADGTEFTGVAAGSVTASYWRQGGARTAIAVAALASPTAAFSAGGWAEIDSTNMKGVYRFDVPDAAFAAGAEWVVIYLITANGFCYPERFNIESAGSAEIYTRLGAPNGTSISADIAGVPALVWNTLTSTLTTANTVGKRIADNLDATISSRLKPAVAARDLDVSAAGAVNVDNKSGFSLSGAGVQAIWDNLLSVVYVAGSMGAKLKALALGTDNRVLISTDNHPSGVTVSAVSGSVGGSVGSVTGAVGSVTGSVGSVNGAVTLAGGSISALAAAIETELINDNTGGAFMQAIADKLQAEFNFDDLTIAAIAVAVRDGLLNRVLAGNHDIAGTPGKLLQTAATANSVSALGSTLGTQIGNLNNLSLLQAQNAATAALTAANLATAQQATNIQSALASVPTANDNANATWTRNERTLTDGGGNGGSGGATPQEIWEYENRTLTSGGGGGGADFTPEQKAQLLTDTNYTANRLRATGSGNVNEPILLTPVSGVPADMVAIFWNPTEFRTPSASRAYIGYTRNTEPLVGGPPSVDLTAKKVYPVMPKDAEGNEIPNAMPYWILPKSSTVSGWKFYLSCPEANHGEDRPESQFVIPDTAPPIQQGGIVGYTMSQLLDRTFNPLP